LQATENSETTVSDLRKIIEADAPMVLRILKVANSALYGFPREIETISHAIALIGSSSLKNLVLAASMRQMFKEFGELERYLWVHCATAGPVAARLAREPELEINPEEAFIAGLLHDVGQIALVVSHREQYLAVAERANQGIPYSEAERSMFGFDHAELGGQIAIKWRLPVSLERAIRHHHDGEGINQLEDSDKKLTALIALTTACLTRLGIGRAAPIETLDPTQLPAWQILGLSEDAIDSTLEIVSEEAKKAESLFN
jgi:putative nucleotidyltransferase with HDIG domain